MEDGVGGIVMTFGSQSGGLPDLADGVWAETDDPASDEGSECGEDLGDGNNRQTALPARRGWG